MTDLQKHAERYHALGANVLPIKQGKIPSIAWDGLQENRQSLEELQSYDWDACTGIGIVCGINGYRNFDIDGTENDATLHRLLQGLNLPETYPWIGRSGSGKGHHLWVRCPDLGDVSIRKGVLKGFSRDGNFKQLELRIRSCQTVVPPSIHTSGNQYEWINGVPVEPPALVSAEQLISVFESVAKLSVTSETEKPVFSRSQYVDLLANDVNEGQRNDTLAKLAMHFRDSGVTFSECVILLKLWNENLSSPLTDDEVERTVQSIYSRPSRAITFYTGIELKMMERPDVDDLIDGIIREQSLTFLAGEEGAGKSITAMNLALAVATGREKFLGYRVKRHGKVVYLNNELPFDDFLIRYKDMLWGLSAIEKTKLDNLIVPDSVPPMNELIGELKRVITEHKPALVTLDCFYWAHDRKENDSSEMKELMRQLTEIRDVYKLAVVVVHHTKKGTRYETMHNDNMRGSSVFGGAADSVLMFRRSETDESKRLFKPTKLRHGSDDARKARLLELNKTTLWFTDLGEANEQDHIARLGGTDSAKDDGPIDWKQVFKDKVELARKDIVAVCKSFGLTERTIDRRIKAAVNGEDLVQVRHGFYSLPKEEDPAGPAVTESTLPAAA